MKGKKLWVLAVLTYGVFDVISTAAALQLGLVEMNPLFQWFNHTHPAAVFVAASIMKVVVFTAAYFLYIGICRVEIPGFRPEVVPAVISVFGVLIVVNNGYWLLAVLL